MQGMGLLNMPGCFSTFFINYDQICIRCVPLPVVPGNSHWELSIRPRHSENMFLFTEQKKKIHEVDFNKIRLWNAILKQNKVTELCFRQINVT